MLCRFCHEEIKDKSRRAFCSYDHRRKYEKTQRKDYKVVAGEVEKMQEEKRGSDEPTFHIDSRDRILESNRPEVEKSIEKMWQNRGLQSYAKRRAKYLQDTTRRKGDNKFNYYKEKVLSVVEEEVV